MSRYSRNRIICGASAQSAVIGNEVISFFYYWVVKVGYDT